MPIKKIEIISLIKNNYNIFNSTYNGIPNVYK